MSQSTPWGRADSQRQIAPGITWYSTPSHGGFYLHRDRIAAMPAVYRDRPTFAGPGWYEEDCDWCLVALSFPDLFPTDQEAAQLTYEWMTKRAATA